MIPAAALRLRRLSLRNFRSYAAVSWQPAQRISVITGPNGAGKTNLLEAVSALASSRGLRNARLGDFARIAPDGDGTWTVAGRLQHPVEGTLEVATGTTSEGPNEGRAVRLDGRRATHAAARRRIAMVWLTPEMGRLFQEGPAGRRRFLDRMIYALEPGHGRELAAYETAMAGRNRLLASSQPDSAWLAGIEESMARHAVAVAVARALFVADLSRVLPDAVPGLPAVALELACPVSERVASRPALEVEEWLARTLVLRRQADREVGTAGLGVHRSDLVMRVSPAGMPASRASTGEQKALLLALVVGHAALLAERRGFAPLVLLDEPLASLDSDRRAALFAILANGSAEVLLTGTEAAPFRPLAAHADFLRAGSGRLIASCADSDACDP